MDSNSVGDETSTNESENDSNTSATKPESSESSKTSVIKDAGQVRNLKKSRYSVQVTVEMEPEHNTEPNIEDLNASDHDLSSIKTLDATKVTTVVECDTSKPINVSGALVIPLNLEESKLNAVSHSSSSTPPENLTQGVDGNLLSQEDILQENTIEKNKDGSSNISNIRLLDCDIPGSQDLPELEKHMFAIPTTIKNFKMAVISKYTELQFLSSLPKLSNNTQVADSSQQQINDTQVCGNSEQQKSSQDNSEENDTQVCGNREQQKSLQHNSEEQISLNDTQVCVTSQDSKDIQESSASQTTPKKREDLTNIYVQDTGNKWYHGTGRLVTPPIDPKKLPEAFGYLPIYGRPTSKNHLQEFRDEKIREFVGFDLSDEEFQNLALDCRPDALETGAELVMMSKTPTAVALLPVNSVSNTEKNQHQLRINKKLAIRMEKEKELTQKYNIKLKYRGLKMMPLSDLQDFTEDDPPESLLEPGKDLIFRIRIYRGFPYSLKERHSRSRHSVFSHDVVLAGRLPLTALRERIVCPNDADMRLDRAKCLDKTPTAKAQDVFQSGFLFINNVFYVDMRPGCHDLTAGLRAWAETRGKGTFPAKDMSSVKIEELVIKLGHPEVYVHQGNCEHLFTFSEIRLVGPSDPLKLSHYPAHTAVAQNQSIYCTACAEFCAKWVIAGCDRVPFDPAFFCDMCLRRYLYDKDGKAIGDFKAYLYKVNEINILKPTHGKRKRGKDFKMTPLYQHQNKRRAENAFGGQDSEHE